jgi:hypothetical protein
MNTLRIVVPPRNVPANNTRQFPARRINSLACLEAFPKGSNRAKGNGAWVFGSSPLSMAVTSIRALAPFIRRAQ